MSEQISYTASFSPTPRTPTFWEKVKERARTEMAVAGGLASSDLSGSLTSGLRPDAKREGDLKPLESGHFDSDLLLQEAAASLRELGYELAVRGPGLRATRGQTCIWLITDARGVMNLEVSGFSGKQCLTEIKAFENRMTGRGIKLERSSRHEPRKPEQGELAGAPAGGRPRSDATRGQARLWGRPRAAREAKGRSSTGLKQKIKE